MSNKILPKIGFIGLGLMGSAIVNRLQDLNYSLTVLGRSRNEGIDKAEKRGATVAKDASELAANSEVIFICVDTSKSVESIMSGENGLIANVKAGSIVIDLGTSVPESTKAIGAKLKEKGVSFMDAPLGRTPKHALDGLLNIINPYTNRIHSSFNQTITTTGRISSTEPNMQNIPVRLEIGRELRKVFIAQENMTLV